MKKIIVFLAILLTLQVGSAFAVSCQESRAVADSSDMCWTTVTIASNETTLVSQGTVLVYDISTAKNTALSAGRQVRVSTASAAGIYVAGVAQMDIETSDTALVQIRGKGKVAYKTVDTVTSGSALFVSTSGDGSTVTSTTQTQLGFALEAKAQSTGNTRGTLDAFITIL